MQYNLTLTWYSPVVFWESVKILWTGGVAQVTLHLIPDYKVLQGISGANGRHRLVHFSFGKNIYVQKTLT